MPIKKKGPLTEQISSILKKVLIDLYENDKVDDPEKYADDTITAYNNRTMTPEQDQKVLEASELLQEIA